MDVRAEGVVHGHVFAIFIWVNAHFIDEEGEVWRDRSGLLTKGYPRQSENYDPFFCLMSKCSFNPLFIFLGFPRNYSLFSVSSGDKHLKSHDISFDFASTGLLTFTCGYLFIVQTSL